MARGSARAPSQNAYRGALGRTQTATVHVAGPRGDLIPVQVYTTIDAVSDPELVERLHSEDPARALNAVRLDGGEPVRVAVPVLYHDPAAELLVLVLGDAHRHRELDERIRVLERLRAEDAPLPAYAKEFAVVYGAGGLRGYLERRAHEALEAARMHEATRELERRTRDVDRRAIELDAMRSDFAARGTDLTARRAELDHARAEVEQGRAEVGRARAELDRLRGDARQALAQAQQAIAHMQQAATRQEPEGERTLIGPPPERDDHETHETRPVPRIEARDLEEAEGTTTERATTERTAEAIDAGGFDGASGALGALGALGAIDAGGFDGGSGALGALGPSGVAERTAAAQPSGTAPAPPAAAAPPAPAATAQAAPAAPSLPAGSDPLTTVTADLPLEPGPDAWLERVIASQASAMAVDALGVVRLALVVGEQLARGLTDEAPDVRLLLHRVATYPVIALLVGPPAAFRTPRPAQLAALVLDVAAERDRAVLAALARRFELIVDVIARGRRLRRARLTAPLHDNVGYIVRAAEDHLRGVMAEGEAALPRAKELVLGAGFDLLGVEQPDAAEFRDDKLAQLQTAQQVRRALSIVRKFARPSREDYLVCLRGFPLPRWRELRRRALETAVAFGLWMGPDLAQVAVSEGLARSRRDLVAQLDRAFEALRRHPTAFDIDSEAAEDNQQALADEARALGVELHKTRGGAIASDEVSTVSGSIGGTPAQGLPRHKSVDELIALLDDKQQRLDAALQLCDRSDPRGAAPVVAAASRMGRTEAVRVLGKVVKLGAAAKVPLLEGLASSKAFFRHGCALALALLRSEDGTQAVIDLLMTEPTEIWREIARAIGQVGPPALLPLASTYGRVAATMPPAIAERVAWAMAHIAVRGGRAAIEAMAGGQSVVAPVARHALELHASAANDQVRVAPGASGSQPGRDVTVNRAFSRRFFESLDQSMPEAAEAGLISLDEADIIEEDEAEDEAAELDESDLIQT